MPIKCSIEILYHYNCSLCSKWWSVADIPSVLGQEMTCPHCGETGAIEEMKNGEGEDVTSVLWQKSSETFIKFAHIQDHPPVIDEDGVLIEIPTAKMKQWEPHISIDGDRVSCDEDKS